MAPVRTQGTAYEALLELEKSNEPFRQQILQAADIIKIDLSDSSAPLLRGGSDHGAEQQLMFSGREEWVLRWLLKKLESQNNDARLDPRVWLLMKSTIARIPVENAARLLNAHDFLPTLEKGLTEALAKAQAADDQYAAAQAGGPKGMNDTSEGSRSSSTVFENSTSTSLKHSKKRKRSGYLVENGSGTDSPRTAGQSAQNLLRAIFGALSQVVFMSTTSSNVDNHLASQYMTAVLKTNPGQAACILGTAINAATHLIPDEKLLTPVRFIVEASPLMPFFTVWEYRSVSADDLFGRASNEAFSSHCLVPALVLLSTCRKNPQKDPAVDHTITILEQIIARHIILPSRSSFLATIEQGAPKSSPESTPLVLIDALRSVNDGHAMNLTLANESESRERVLSTIPYLFDIAVRCLRRDSPRRRITEAPWLEALFLYLVQTADLPVHSESAVTLSQQSLQILEQLLQMAIDKGVLLDTLILRNIVSCFSGILQEGMNNFQWTLIGKILRLDANVFLIPTEVHDDQSGSSEPRYGLLSSLFARTTAARCSLCSRLSDDYQSLKSSIVLPLLRESAKARDLGGFLRRWQGELIARAEFHTDSDDELTDSTKPRHLSIWEDVDLANELRSLLEGSLTAGQIDNVLSLSLLDLKSFLNSGSVAVPRAYASLVILDVVMGAVQREETLDSVSLTVQSIGEAITAMLSPTSKWPKEHRWRLWRILTSTSLQWHQNWLDICRKAAEQTDTPGPLHTGWALEVIGTVSLSKPGPNAMRFGFKEYLEVLQAFQYVLSLTSFKPEGNEVNAWLPEVIERSLQSIIPVFEDTLSKARCGSKSLNLNWDGKPETLTSQGALVVALATVILRFPHCLKLATAATRSDALQTMHQLGQWQDSGSQGPGQALPRPLLVSVWEGLLESDEIRNESSVLESFLDILVTEIGLEINASTSDQKRHCSPGLVVRVLLGLPMTILKRQYREKILDVVHERTLKHHHHSGHMSLAFDVALMTRLMEAPNASSELATDAAALWELAHVYDQSSLDYDADGFFAFEELAKLILSHLISTKDQDRSRKYLKKFHARLDRSLTEPNPDPDGFGTQHLLNASLAVFWLHRGNLLKPLKEKELIRLRRVHLGSLTSNLRTFDKSRLKETSELSTKRLLVTLDSMLGYRDLLQTEENRDAVYHTLSAILSTVMPTRVNNSDTIFNEAPPTDALKSRVLASLFSLVSYTQEDGGNNVWDLPGLLQLLQITTFADQRQLLITFRDHANAMTLEDKLDLLSNLVEQGLGTVAESNLLRLIPVLLSSIDDPGKHSEGTRTAISNAFVRLCSGLWQGPDYRQFCFAAQSMAMIIRQKPWAMTQWGIDNALSAITMMLSPSSPQLPPQHAVIVYQHLCSLMRSLVAIHRTKLGGRYHLVLPLIQAMLRCFFTPDASRARSSKGMSLPPWLPAKVARLDVSSAAAYARILTAICEPTVSSVTRSKGRSRSNLNDETKKVRATAGEYLHYLIMEYARCQLHGRISPEIKIALTPGLYAVFGVLSKETLRTLNAVMDSSSRAIFKVLYDDYRRFGKWDQT